MPAFDLDDFTPYRLALLSARISRRFAAIYGPKFGLSRAEWRILAHLSQEAEVSIREIARRVDMDKSKLSRATARLETRGLLSKTPNPGDRRLLQLKLTEDGRAMIAELAPLALAFEQEVHDALGPDAEAFDRAIRRLSAAAE
jgi:DNA-binding MarR family transcriptional regulator